MTEESLFEAVLQKPAGDRASFLEEACGADLGLLAKLRALLAAHEKDRGILEQPAQPAALLTEMHVPTERAGVLVGGRYKLREQIGEGGMGTVWVAEQTEPVRRKVALKLIKAGMDSRAVLSRFEAERQALALMDHPNIAKVLDGGTTEGGRPFFVMEYVKGIPLTKYCDEARLSVAERLALFVPVCNAIQHAHQKGIIHRDLKPSNILVCLYDGQPVPKVIDFGLAKAMHQPLTEHTVYTSHGLMMGTPLYMSPEQAELNNLDVDTRTDIYALGVILYELLTGTTPLERKRFQDAAWQEMLRLIKEEEPPRPSARLSGSVTLPSVAAQRKLEPVQLTRLVRGELDWIVMKALEKERSRRYETANGFARDIQHYLADEPVEACPPSASYRMRKFARKHRSAIMTAAAIMLLLLAGVAVSTWQAIRATQAKTSARLAEAEAAQDRDKALKAEALAKGNEERANRQEAEAVRQAKIAKENEESANKAAQEKGLALKKSDADRKELNYNLAQDQILLAQTAFDSGNSSVAHERLTKVPPDLRHWEWRYLKRQYEGGIFTLYGHKASVTSVAFSPDGTRLASGSWDRTARIWDARTGTPALDFRGHTREVTSVMFSPDGARLATGSTDMTARIWDARTGTALVQLKGHTGGVSSVAFSSDGTRLATGSGDKTVKIWDARTGTPLLTLLDKGYPGHVWGVAFSPDGTRLASTSDDNTARIWDARSGMPLLRLHWNSSNLSRCRVAFSPDGTRLATGGTNQTAIIWDARTGTKLLDLEGHTNWVNSVAFSPDGTRLATGSTDKTVKIWDARIGTPLVDLKGHTSGVNSVEFSPDGTRIASGSFDTTAKMWDARTGTPLLDFKGHTRQVSSVAFSTDATRLITGSWDGTAKIWDARTGTLARDLEGHKSGVSSLALSPDGTRLATGSFDATAKIWDLRTGTPLLDFKGHTGNVQGVAFSLDGTRLATAGTDKTAKIWDARIGTKLLDLEGHTGWVMSVAFSPDGTRLATGSMDVSVKIWDARTGTILLDLKGPSSHQAYTVVFSPDGTRLATAGVDGTAKVWDTRTGTLLLDLKGHGSNVHGVAFSPDGMRLATGSLDKTVKIWDARTGTPLLDLKGHSGAVTSVAFSPDGTRLATGSADNTARIWDAGSSMQKIDRVLPPEERSYRLFWTRPRPDVHRQEYVKALQAKDTFAANFHLHRLEPLDVMRVLRDSGRLEEARVVWHKALESNPPKHDSWYGYAELCLFLGNEEEYGRARRILLERFGATADASTAERTGRACLLLPATGDELGQAAALVDRAVAAGPKHQYYVFFMAAKGLAEYRQDRADSAIGWLEKAIAGKANMPARIVLAMAQHRLGRVEEARKTLAVAINSYNWNQVPEKNHDVWICHALRREAEALIVPNLAAFLKGDYQPKDNAERLEFAKPCRIQLRPLAAARLLADAFAPDAKLADDVKARHRYDAACYAALAGSGQGKDADELDDKERTSWRKQARDWLRADLIAHQKQPDSGRPIDRSLIVRHLKEWQKDFDLAGIRDREALAKLSAEERKECQKLWADVETLLRKAQGREYQ